MKSLTYPRLLQQLVQEVRLLFPRSPEPKSGVVLPPKTPARSLGYGGCTPTPTHKQFRNTGGNLSWWEDKGRKKTKEEAHFTSQTNTPICRKVLCKVQGWAVGLEYVGGLGAGTAPHCLKETLVHPTFGLNKNKVAMNSPAKKWKKKVQEKTLTMQNWSPLQCCEWHETQQGKWWIVSNSPLHFSKPDTTVSALGVS